MEARDVLQEPIGEPGIDEARGRVLDLCNETAHALKVNAK
jgi:hypothetical protein